MYSRVYSGARDLLLVREGGSRARMGDLPAIFWKSLWMR
jgi:hypothetical protein